MSYFPPVTIIIVNWNGLQDTLECLESLAHVQYDCFSVVVVDNGSKGDDATLIEECYPNITVLKTGRNLGFTGGNNVGIHYALQGKPDYVLCLNNDTIVCPNFLPLMVNAMEAHPEVGIATSAIFYYDQPEKLAALGSAVSFAELPPVRHITDDCPQTTEGIIEVAAVDGCVLMMRTTVAEATRGFDEAFFAYVEDADLCLRTRKLGFQCAVVPDARVWHKVGSTTGGEYSPSATYYYSRNIWRLARLHGTQEEIRRFMTMQIKAFTSKWRWFFKQCIIFAETKKDLRQRQDITDYTFNAVSGYINCGGPRHDWKRLEKLVGALSGVTIIVSIIAGQLLHPLYCFWRSSRKRNILKTFA